MRVMRDSGAPLYDPVAKLVEENSLRFYFAQLNDETPP